MALFSGWLEIARRLVVVGRWTATPMRSSVQQARRDDYNHLESGDSPRYMRLWRVKDVVQLQPADLHFRCGNDWSLEHAQDARGTMKNTDTFGMLKLAAHQRGRHQMSGRDSGCEVVRPVISDERGLDANDLRGAMQT